MSFGHWMWVFLLIWHPAQASDDRQLWNTRKLIFCTLINNGQNSFYKNFFVILHVNAPYTSASECWRKKRGTRTRLDAMLTWISVIFTKINGNIWNYVFLLIVFLIENHVLFSDPYHGNNNCFNVLRLFAKPIFLVQVKNDRGNK